VANLIPLVGVLFFDWSLLTILVLYWIENGIVGFWNVPKIVMAQGSIVTIMPELPHAAALAATRSEERATELEAQWAKAREAQLAEQRVQADAQQASPTQRGAAGRVRVEGVAGVVTAMSRLAGVGRVGLAMFFALHYGIFWFVHGIFVFALPAFGNGFGLGDGTPCAGGPIDPGFPGTGVGLPSCASGAFGDVLWPNVLLAAVALFISHGASFLFNFIGRGEYIVTSAARQMATPYGRVVVLHLTIIIGSIIVSILGAPIGALVILIGLKTAFDLGLHLREHRNSGPPVPAGAASAARRS